MLEEIRLQEIRYFRQVRPPTLQQFLLRRAVKEVMENAKGRKGVTLNPETGFLVPASALVAKNSLKGLKADKIATLHPDWVEEYNLTYRGK